MQIKQALATLSLAGILCVPQVSFAKSFHDVTKTNSVSWAYDAIDQLSNINILNGFPDGTFQPNHPVSFLETMQILKGLMNPTQDVLNSAMSTYGAFVKEQGVDAWAQEAVAFNLYINTITQNTLTSAKKGGFLKAKSPVYPSRNSIAVYMGRALRIEQNKPTSLLQYKDVNRIPVVTLNYLPGLVEAKIFTATGSEGQFNGSHFIRRSEMAVIAKQTLEYLKVKPSPYETGNLLEGIDAPVEAPQIPPQPSNGTSDITVPPASTTPDSTKPNSTEPTPPPTATPENKEDVHFEGQVKKIIDGGSVTYLEVDITKSDNTKLTTGQLITISTTKRYQVGDVVRGQGIMGERNLLDIKLN